MLYITPKAENGFPACKGELSSEPERWEGDFVSMSMTPPPAPAEQTQMEMPPGKDIRLNNPHSIWEECLSSQGMFEALMSLLPNHHNEIEAILHPRALGPEDFLRN